MGYFPVVLCDTWNWSDDNDTILGIAIPEMRYALSMSFRIRQPQTISTGNNYTALQVCKWMRQ